VWPTLVEAVTAVVAAGIVGTGLFAGLSAVAQGDRVARQELYGAALVASVMESVSQDTYTPYPTAVGYPTSGQDIPNPLGYPVSLTVLNYQAGATPAFSQDYPDSGLQEVVVEVALPDGEVLRAVTYKVR
jgi:hypothetical protein